VAPDAGELVGPEAVDRAEPFEVLAESGSFGLPAADADVEVLGLGEEPAVAARHDAELEEERRAVGGIEGRVPFEGDAVRDLLGQSERLRHDAVRAVGADQDVCGRGTAGQAHGGAFDLLHPNAVAKVSAGGGRALSEEGVEPGALCEQDERLFAPPLVPSPVPRAEANAGRAILDDGVDGLGEEPDSAPGEPTPAGLVAGEAGAVEKEDGGAAGGEAVGSDRPGGPGADDDGVEPLHESGS
jgi:hypothetical protein